VISFTSYCYISFEFFLHLMLIHFVDWLRERVFFEGLSRDDSYVKSRLGFRAANVFIMDLTS